MYSSPRLATISRVTAFCLLTALLTACGASGASAKNDRGASARPSATPIPRPTFTFNSAASVDMHGLHIQSGGVDCGARLVLRNRQGAYDSGAIQQLATFARAFEQSYYVQNQEASAGAAQPVQFTPQVESQLPPLPSTSAGLVPGDGGDGCTDLVTITNTSNSTVQIASLGAAVIATPVQNTVTYRLIDVCSLPDALMDVCQLTGSGGPPCGYHVELTLNGGLGTEVNGPIQASAPGCPAAITLSPTQAAQVSVGFGSSSQSVDLVRLSLTLSTTGASATINLPPSFNSSLVFASRSQFACYWLQGDKFVEEQQAQTGGVPPLYFGFVPPNPTPEEQSVCL